MSRFKTTQSDNSLEKLVTAIFTGGASLVIDFPKDEVKTEVEDTYSGQTGVGYGATHNESERNARKDLQEKKS